MATGNVRATGLPWEVDDWLELLKDLVDNVKAWAEAARGDAAAPPRAGHRETGRHIPDPDVGRFRGGLGFVLAVPHGPRRHEGGEVLLLIVGRKVGNLLVVEDEEFHEHQVDPPESAGGGSEGDAE